MVVVLEMYAPAASFAVEANILLKREGVATNMDAL
jgi:hypothetical protein